MLLVSWEANKLRRTTSWEVEKIGGATVSWEANEEEILLASP